MFCEHRNVLFLTGDPEVRLSASRREETFYNSISALFTQGIVKVCVLLHGLGSFLMLKSHLSSSFTEDQPRQFYRYVNVNSVKFYSYSVLLCEEFLLLHTSDRTAA